MVTGYRLSYLMWNGHWVPFELFDVQGVAVEFCVTHIT